MMIVKISMMTTKIVNFYQMIALCQELYNDLLGEYHLI